MRLFILHTFVSRFLSLFLEFTFATLGLSAADCVSVQVKSNVASLRKLTVEGFWACGL